MTDSESHQPRDTAQSFAGRHGGVASGGGGGILFLAALVLGLTRFFQLGEWSLWMDEAFTVADYSNRLDAGGIGNAAGYLFIRLTVDLFGGTPDEFSLRFLPALFGYLTIPLVFVSFRRFVGSRRAGACALLIAVSSWHLYWSQNARFYTFAQFFSLLGCVLVVRAYFRGGLLRAFIGYGFASAAALFHPSAGLLVPVIVVLPFVLPYLRVEAPPQSRRLALYLLGFSLLCFAAAFGKLSAMWGEYQYDKSQGSPVPLLLTTGFYVTPVLAGAALLGAVLTWLRRDRFGLIAVTLVAGSFITAIAISFFARVVAQYVFVLLPWILLLACVPLDANEGERSLWNDKSEGRRPSLGWAYFLILLAPQLVSTGLYHTKRAGERPRWKEAYHYVYGEIEEGDAIFGMGAPIGEYYLSPQTADYRQPVHIGWFDRYRPRLAEKWARFGRKIWIVVQPKYFEDWPEDTGRNVKEFLARDCRLVRSYPLNVDTRDLSLYVYVYD